MSFPLIRLLSIASVWACGKKEQLPPFRTNSSRLLRVPRSLTNSKSLKNAAIVHRLSFASRYDPSPFVGSIPGCPYRITVPATALREINNIVAESYYAAPRGGVEIGGVFFGIAAGESLHILAYRPVCCQYLTGPSFKLSLDDKKHDFRACWRCPESDPKLAKLSVLGWYHSPHRSEICQSQDDRELSNEVVPGARPLALGLRPGLMKATRAGFFFRDAEGRIQTNEPLQEFIVDPPGSELTLLEGEAQSTLEQLLDAQGVHPHAGDGDGLPAAAKPEAPQPKPELPSPQAIGSAGPRS